eukprot:2406571-Pyramimonas_sp.AAC.1
MGPRREFEASSSREVWEPQVYAPGILARCCRIPKSSSMTGRFYGPARAPGQRDGTWAEKLKPSFGCD